MFWSQDPLYSSKLLKLSKELLFTWIISLFAISDIKTEHLKNFRLKNNKPTTC